MPAPRRKTASPPRPMVLPKAIDGGPGWDLWVVAALVAAVAALAIRIAAARGELWLDEVWTIHLVSETVDSPADVVLRLKHDNNHFLNSLIAYFVGDGGESWHYRLPAVMAGTAAVLLAGWAQWPLGKPTVLAALVLVGASHLAVNYSSEARGYAYLMCFSLLSYVALYRAVRANVDNRYGLGWELLFAFSCVGGFLSHATFLSVYLAAQVWTWIAFRYTSPRRAAVVAACRTIVPALFFSWLYFANWSRMDIGGGLDQRYAAVIAQTLSLAVGGPFNAPGTYVAACVTVVASLLALSTVLRQSWSRAAFYVCVIVVMPISLILAASRLDIYPRYFLSSVVFLCLLWSEGLGAIYARPRYGGWLYAGLLVVFLVLNGNHSWRLIANTRGHYQDALALVDRETQAGQVDIAVDHPFRQAMMLDFYSGRVKRQKPLQAFGMQSGAEWLYVHEFDVEAIPAETLVPDHANEYHLVKSYPCAGLSGWNLYVYRRRTP